MRRRRQQRRDRLADGGGRRRSPAGSFPAARCGASGAQKSRCRARRIRPRPPGRPPCCGSASARRFPHPRIRASPADAPQRVVDQLLFKARLGVRAQGGKAAAAAAAMLRTVGLDPVGRRREQRLEASDAVAGRRLDDFGADAGRRPARRAQKPRRPPPCVRRRCRRASCR